MRGAGRLRGCSRLLKIGCGMDIYIVLRYSYRDLEQVGPYRCLRSLQFLRSARRLPSLGQGAGPFHYFTRLLSPYPPGRPEPLLAAGGR